MENTPDTRAMYQAKYSIANILTSLGIQSLRLTKDGKQCFDTGQDDPTRLFRHDIPGAAI
jgi:hypothetical protein